MLSILFLVLAGIFGISLIRMLVPDIRRLIVAAAPSKNVAAYIPDLMFTIPAGTVLGMMSVTAFSYYLTSIESRFLTDIKLIKTSSLIATVAVFVVLTAVNFSVYLKKKKNVSDPLIPEFENTPFNMIFFGASVIFFTLISAFLFFYSYKISNGSLHAGYSVFSDLSPHTAITTSFGVGFNFPTQYMHFSGDGIQYHFFFYYLCGLLQSMGLPIDFAINIPSIIVMVCAFILLGLLSVLLSKRRIAFLIAPVLVLFRSSFNFIYQIIDCTREYGSFGTAMDVIFTNREWYGKTPFDTWGIWAINVYSNQRHLMLGVSFIIIMMICLLPFIRRMCISLIKSPNTAERIRYFFISPYSWAWRKKDPLNPLGIMILLGIIVIEMPFFHGSALIAGLLIAAMMAVFSESRLIYLVMAACSVVSAFIQTRLFAGNVSSVFSPKFAPGFVCEQPSFKNISIYIITVTGLTLVLAVIYSVVFLFRDITNKTPVYRPILFLCSLAPFVYAFLWQTSLEMLANHKFIQISLIIADAYVAGLMAELFRLPFKKDQQGNYVSAKKKRLSLQILSIILAAVLAVPLTATGVFEWSTYINLNKISLSADTHSALVEWVENNTEPSDVFLTPNWSFNRFILTGRPMYFGWPYYAWSAGHDTDRRYIIYSWLLNGCGGDSQAFTNYCRERGIKYVVADPELANVELYPGFTYDPEFFEQNLTPVAYFPEERGTIIYQVYS
ncbi:MAG: hypothetical protein J5685_12535 [Clostridiales bacterium]|nr:hypothetical protein [Clostridiales bacterium]